MLNNIDITGLTIERLVEIHEILKRKPNNDLLVRIEKELKRRRWL